MLQAPLFKTINELRPDSWFNVLKSCNNVPFIIKVPALTIIEEMTGSAPKGPKTKL